MLITVLPCVVLALLAFVCVMVIGLLILGAFRVKLSRKISFEGIEDPEMVKAYDRMSRMPQFALIRRMFANELKRHKPLGKIVDVGCGPGYLLRVIAQKVPDADLVGVDISDEMLATASQNISAWGFGSRAEFHRGEAQKIPFSEGSIDNIISTLSLHHWSSPRDAFIEFYRVLKPGGQFLLMDMRRDPRRIFYWLVFFATKVAPTFLGTGALRRVNEPLGSLLASYTPPEIGQMLSGLPFSSVSIRGG
ncbi:MAG: class I SAM-dependent methyltransferase, partial [Candidatus Methanomethylicus sp.]|nr:class I SAM-dependent methyltransferase [Candidatus Methanomethylicus sp.]